MGSILMASPWLSSVSIGTRTPSASLTLRRSSSASLCAQSNPTRSHLLQSSFTAPSSALSFPSSSFSGLSLGLDLSSNIWVRTVKRKGLVVRAGKAALCQTKRNRSRKSRARTHGFRRRMRTTSGRAVLKRRRAKGRKVLCTQSYPNSGKRA